MYTSYNKNKRKKFLSLLLFITLIIKKFNQDLYIKIIKHLSSMETSLFSVDAITVINSDIVCTSCLYDTQFRYKLNCVSLLYKKTSAISSIAITSSMI